MNRRPSVFDLPLFTGIPPLRWRQKTLWSDQYEIEIDSVLTAQDELALTAVGQVHRHLGTGEVTEIQAPGTENVMAYSLYLQGLQHIRDYNGERAIAPLQAAIELDPEFAPAYAELANAYDTMVSGSSDSGANSLSIEQYRDLVGPLVRRALELNENLPETQVAYGIYRDWVFGDTEAKLASMRRAIELAPSYSPPYRWLGLDQVNVRGNLDEGRRYFETALRLDPTYALNAAFVAEARARAGKVEDGRAMMVNAMKSSPSDMVAGNLQYFGWEFGPLADAVKWAQVADAYGVTSPWNYGYASLAWTRVGELDKAREWLLASGAPVAENRVLREAQNRLRLRQGDLGEMVSGETDYYEIVAALLAGGRSEKAEDLLVSRASLEPDYYPEYTIFQIAYSIRYATERGLMGADSLARSGNDIRQRLERSVLFWPTLNYAFATLVAAQGLPDEALALLDKAVRQGWRDPWYTDLDPTLEVVRHLPGYQRLRSRMESELLAEHERMLQSSALVPKAR